MDQFDAVFAMVAKKIADEASEAGQMTLGALIDELKTLPGNMPISWDFGGKPGSADSYRGFYEQLAFELSGHLDTAGEFLDEVRNACGETFHGYKGGEFIMHRGTLVWAGNYGTSAGGRRIVGVKQEGNQAILLTKEYE